MTVTALSIERLTDTVYDILREQIMRGTFRPGDKLNVDQLAQQFNISQTPIKGALARLTAEGLVDIQPRRGTFVATASEKAISEVLAIRVALESLAADTMLEHVTPDELTRLTEIVRAIEVATDVYSHFRQNADFHQRLVELSGNRKLAEMYRQLQAHILIALIHARSTTWRARAAAEAAEHQAILAALACRDHDGLKTAITQHLSRARVSLLEDISSQARG